MGYFTNLIKKHLPDKNDALDVLFVPKSLNTMQQKGSKGTKKSIMACANIEPNVPEGTNSTKQEQRVFCELAPSRSNIYKRFEISGTKEQQEQQFSNISQIRFALILNQLPPDAKYDLEERAAIKEYDGQLSREHAEKEALEEFY